MGGCVCDQTTGCAGCCAGDVWQGVPAFFCLGVRGYIDPYNAGMFYYCGPPGGACGDALFDCQRVCIDETGEGGDFYCAVPCTQGGCTGCCDKFTITDNCHEGNVDDYCGSGAGACERCAQGQHCVNHACVAIPDGGAADGAVTDSGNPDG
jgi:hypothetical protein